MHVPQQDSQLSIQGTFIITVTRQGQIATLTVNINLTPESASGPGIGAPSTPSTPNRNRRPSVPGGGNISDTPGTTQVNTGQETIPPVVPSDILEVENVPTIGVNGLPNNSIDTAIVIDEISSVLQDYNIPELNEIITEISQVMLDSYTIEVDVAIEKITQILRDNDLSEDEIAAIIEELTLLLEIDDDVIEEIQPFELINDIIRAPVGSNVIYRGDGINWTPTFMDTTTFIAEDGTIMVSVRFMAYVLEAQVFWNQNDATISLNATGVDVQLAPGSSLMYVNGSRFQLINNHGINIPAYLRAEHGRTFVPMSALGTAFNIEYRWDSVNQEAVFYIDTNTTLLRLLPSHQADGLSAPGYHH